MSQFTDAVKLLRDSEIVCPKCHATNVPGASPTIVVDPYDHAACDQCGHSWTVKEK